MLQAELKIKNEEPSEQTELLNQESGTAALSEELQTSLLEKQVSKRQNKLADMKSILKRQRKKNNGLWMKKFSTIEALTAMKATLQRELSNVQELQARLAVKDQEIKMVQTELENRTKELRKNDAGSSTVLPKSCRRSWIRKYGRRKGTCGWRHQREGSQRAEGSVDRTADHTGWLTSDR